jgi:hypothetical protein
MLHLQDRSMFSIALGVLLLVGGIILAATRTAARGKLSDPHATGVSRRLDTLEPRGRGGRLSIKADLPGFALMAIGALLLLTAFI